MIEELRKNVDMQIEILREISTYSRRAESANLSEAKILRGMTESLKNRMKIINNSIPQILVNVSISQRLPGRGDGTNLEKIKYAGADNVVQVTLVKKDRDKFFEELSISEGLMKKIKGKAFYEQEKIVNEEFKAARGYVKMSNRFFLNTATDMIKRGYFRDLSGEINKSNMDILFEAYVAVTLFTTVLSVFAGILILMFFTYFSLGITPPFVSLYSGGNMMRFFKLIWIPFLVPVLTLAVMYYYPSTEKNTIARKVDQELPFAVIHMSAISGSGIEPMEIFKIIATSREYPVLRKELRKVLNQINLYGYDLVTALNNVIKSTPSPKLAELFAGLSTTISSGGSLNEYFQKRAEGLLIDYRLEREKYTKVAETFMDIYISIVIAAPMILMLLLIMISISGFALPFPPNQMALIIVLIIGLINMIFIGVLQVKQPSY
jgi:flagellar protein FlaJ